ncbi:MAG: cation:proton antiporter [Acidobacteriota bacterium]
MLENPASLLTHLLAGGPEAAKIPLMMLFVFGAAKLSAELFERLKQPGIVGEILAGVLIGPQVLGLVQPNEFLTALADLGVMFLLFNVGLEVKASEMFKVGPTALIVAILGVIVPFALGWGLLSLWGEPQIEAIFVGAAMVATSVGITAQVLASKGLLAAKASKIILAAAVIDDILGLLVLAAVSSMASGTVQILDLISTAVVAVGFTILVVWFGGRTVGKLVQRADEKLRVAEGQFALAMVLLFALSVLAIYAGVAAIIGAFLAGMALSESSGPRMHDLSHGVTELLVPFFLAGIGLHFDIAVFANPSTLYLAALILVAAVVSKVIGCGLGALKLGMADALRVGVGMMPRGEVGMVVAQIGMSLGVISHHVYGVVVFMAVTTTLLAPPLLKRAYSDLTRSQPKQTFRIG